MHWRPSALVQAEGNFKVDAVRGDLVSVHDNLLPLYPCTFDAVNRFGGLFDAPIDGIVETLPGFGTDLYDFN